MTRRTKLNDGYMITAQFMGVLSALGITESRYVFGPVVFDEFVERMKYVP